MKLILSFFLFIAVMATSLAQNTKPTLRASRISENIRIDGELNEASWARADKTSHFITLDPVPGKPSSQLTSVSLLYDDNGLYIGALLSDTHPDSILTEFSERDGIGNSDFFGLVIDPYQSGLNGFEFITTPRNVQFDAILNNNSENSNWDAVWKSKAVITAEGWALEMFIPYSAIRFPKTSIQTWNINFFRLIQRKQEKSFWSELDPQVSGFLNQSGTLTGIENIKAPFRLQLTPFATVAGAKLTDPQETPKTTYGHSIGGGLDLKLGLSDAFTLDMTVIPDFSEARSDDNVLNLGPFEQRFDEQRAFFTEGTELFNKGGFFYSRRVGGRHYQLGKAFDSLQDDEELNSYPSKAQLVNATKISGRTSKGTGIGFFNAIERRSFAEITTSTGDSRSELINPLTNYNVAVVDQNLPNNSSVTLINTNVLREGASTDANVTGLVFDIRNKKNTYSVNGTAGLSNRYTSSGTEQGHKMRLSLNKISGAWQMNAWYGEESDTYNPNDLGLLFSNNERNIGGRIRYNIYEPFMNGFLLQGGAGMFYGHNRLYKDNKYVGDNAEVWIYGKTKHFWNFNLWSDHDYTTWYDYFEPRTENRYLKINPRSNIGGWIGSDDRKALRVNGNFNVNRYWNDSANRREFAFNLGLRYRVSDRLSFNTYVYKHNKRGDLGFVHKETIQFLDENGMEQSREDVFMGRRKRQVVEVGLDGRYSFTSNMTLSLRLRHYWDKVAYDSFHLLEADGSLGNSDYVGTHDLDYDAFNVDLIYRWRFAPGSDIFIVYKSNIQAANTDLQQGYFNNWKRLWKDAPSNENLSLKIVYWLDYASLVN